ncbi:MAG: hemerythrin domain-containing protein [Acidimicrobiales bacterium]
MTDKTNNADAVDLLLEQHQEVRRLFDQVQTAQGDQRREMFDCLLRMLAVHETAEEEVIYPLVRAAVPDGDALADARLEEEAEGKTLLAELEKLGTADSAFSPKLATFQEKVDEHARHEEEKVFPALREHVDPDKLVAARKALETAEAIAPTHPHPHGPDSALGNIVAGPMVAVVDRVRDALRKAG